MYLFTLVEVNIQIQKNNDLNTSLKIYQKLKNNDCSNSNVFELLNISFSLSHILVPMANYTKYKMTLIPSFILIIHV